MHNRRNFVSSLLATSAGLAAAPLFSFPKPAHAQTGPSKGSSGHRTQHYNQICSFGGLILFLPFALLWIFPWQGTIWLAISSGIAASRVILLCRVMLPLEVADSFELTAASAASSVAPPPLQPVTTKAAQSVAPNTDNVFT